MSRRKAQKKDVSGFGCVVLFAIIVFVFVSVKMYFTPTFMEETDISLAEQQHIFEFLKIKSDFANVEKLQYSHVREPEFCIYISGLTEKDLEDNYTIDYYGHYVKNSAENSKIIESQFIEDDGMKIAKFNLNLYDETLYEIVE